MPRSAGRRVADDRSAKTGTPNKTGTAKKTGRAGRFAGTSLENKQSRDMLRHVVATLAYRGGKALRGASDTVARFRVKDGVRTPGEILAHVGDLLDWAVSIANGEHAWHNSVPQAWEQDVARFFDALERLDVRLASDAPLACRAELLFQAPIADALTHVGQIAMLRRVAGSPVRAENYYIADIVSGRVGPEQSAPRMEFD